MKSVRLVQVGKPLEEADIPIPDIGSSDVLIRVAAAGICHSDAHYRAGISRIDDSGSRNANQNIGRSDIGNWNVRLLERFSNLHESHRFHFPSALLAL